MEYFVMGGEGKVRPGTPRYFAEAGTVGRAAAPHFLLVKISGRLARVTPIGETGAPLAVASPDGIPVDATRLIDLSGRP